jgi:hypothetical protein
VVKRPLRTLLCQSLSAGQLVLDDLAHMKLICHGCNKQTESYWCPVLGGADSEAAHEALPQGMMYQLRARGPG